MLIYETNDELISRIESIVYVLSQRMLADELRALLIETVDGAADVPHLQYRADDLRS